MSSASASSSPPGDEGSPPGDECCAICIKSRDNIQTPEDLPPQENYRYTPSSLRSVWLYLYGLGIIRYVSTR
jgi:hypothetical protein